MFNDLARAMAQQARREIAERRAARKVGDEGVMLGISDYRRAPDPNIDSADWAVWRVRWDPVPMDRFCFARRWRSARRSWRNMASI